MAWTSPQTWTTSQVVTAADMNTDVRDNLGALNPLDSVAATSWSPTLKATTTDPETSAATGRYWRVGPLVYAAARWVMNPTSGGGATGSGTFYVALPVTSSGLTASTGSNGQAIGTWRAVDASAGANNENGAALLRTTSEVHFGRQASGLITDATPFTWTTGDVLTFFVVYPAA